MQKKSCNLTTINYIVFPSNHNISFIFSDEIMSQQASFPGHFYLFPRKFISTEITLLLYFPANFPGNLLCHFIFLQVTANPLNKQVFQRSENGKILNCLGIAPSTF
jgi:hypothetical protein